MYSMENRSKPSLSKENGKKRQSKLIRRISKTFGKKNEKEKSGFSMSAGMANAMLACSVGVTGVEEIIKKVFVDIQHSSQSDVIMSYVSDNIIGNDLVYKGPFGARKIVYCDYTASGKSLHFIENYIRDEVLPYYGNTHTTTTISSLQTGTLRTEAKQIIRNCTNATSDDAVIFVSSGTTGAISKLIHALEIKVSPIVFISPYEHHSNLLPWLEIGAEIVYSVEASDGSIDLQVLEEKLQEYSTKGRPMIGSFSAASNITGILTPVDSVAILLHQYGAYAFFDYATAGPYVDIDMNPHLKDETKSSLSYKDAMFCSIHKFVGGPGTPGLLVAKKHVFINPIPSGVGGGTVLFVTHQKHKYIDDIEEREEGGTPAIIESIRAGLVFQLKAEVTVKHILHHEHIFLQAAYERWENIPNLYVLGQSKSDRLPIFALIIKHPTCPKLLHHNFVSALLNDIFGIQSRGGCACAGPYAEDLLGISDELAMSIAEVLQGNYDAIDDVPKEEKELANGKVYNILKPGFCRLNLPYFADEDTISYILDSVVFIAENGWKLLPLYQMVPETGEFIHKKTMETEVLPRLADCKNYQKDHVKKTKNDAPTYKESLRQAVETVLHFERQVKKEPPMASEMFLPPTLSDKMVWFMSPCEAHAKMNGSNPCSTYKPLFFPRTTPDNKKSRSRIKSGLDKETFCLCPKQKGRHIRREMCDETKDEESYDGPSDVNGNLTRVTNKQKQQWSILITNS